MRVILISGKAQHGKDTVANRLAETINERGDSVLVIHFADLLKHMCKTLFGWDGEKDDEGRSLLQYVGTDVVRKKIPDFWVDHIISILKIFKNEWDWVIIPDARFPNEVSKMKETFEGTIHLRVNRMEFDGLIGETKGHTSETALDRVKADFYLLNDGDLEHFNKIIDDFGKETLFG